MGRSYFQRLDMTEHYTNMLPTPTRNFCVDAILN